MTKIKSNKIIKNRTNYYKQVFVLFELLYAMKDREVIFMSKRNNKFCIRGLVILSIDYLQDMFKRYHINEKDYNIYVSLAKYKYIPTFNLDLTKRSLETREWFHKHARNNIKEYDMLLDFDVKDKKEFNKVVEETYLMTQFLNLSKVKYNLIPSGSGFQIKIPSECFDMKKEFANNEFNTKIYQITKTIKERFKLKHLCMIGIGAYNKIKKCEYSLVDDSVVFPLKYNNLQNRFDYKLLKSDLILKNFLFVRNDLKFHNNFTDEENKKNLMRFLKKYMLI